MDIQEIIDAIEDYGDRERYLGKALADRDDASANRWDQDASRKLTAVRTMLENVIPR